MNRLAVLAVCLAASLASAQGLLLPTDPSLKALGIKYQRVSAEIVDGTAVTKVEQVFVNSAPRQLEAHYVFPLPKGAALQEFSLWINGKKTKGEVLEKQKAADIYEGIVRRLQDPGLLEYMDTDAFRARVFPVPANGEQRIELVFSQVLEFSGGLYQYHYPLGASSKGAPPLQVRQDFTFSAKLHSRTPLRSIYSPTHPLGVSRKGENDAVAGLELGAGADISKDLDLFFTVSEKAVGLSFLPYRVGEEPGFFVALISPKTELKADEVLKKRITLVMDTSGSMAAGDRIKLARDAMTYCVQRLSAHDEFNVIRFSTDVEPLFEKPQLASEENVKKALSFVKTFEANGGTAIDEAVLRALKDGEGRGDRPHMVLFVTDGHPTVGDTDEPAIAAHAKAASQGSRVFTFGVGEDLNARLLERLAEQGNGTTDFLRDGKEFEVKVSSFFDKVASPVLSDLALDLSAFGAFDVYPKRLPDLFKGSQLVVMGRYRTPKDGTALLTGHFNGKKQVFEYRADASASAGKHEFVPRLWAIRKVGYLLDEIRLRGERSELKDEVVSLGKKYGIVTPYTSYLVVEDSPTPVAQPSPDVQGGGFGSRERGPSGPPADEADEVFRRSVVSMKVTPKPASPRAGDPAKRDAFASPEPSLGGVGSSGSGSGVLNDADGKQGILVAKKLKSMKEQELAAKPSEPVRVASGRTFLFRGGAWVDSEALTPTAKQLTIKALSDAAFALLKARPELKAALALGSRVTVLVGPGKSITVAPDAGETSADKVLAFLK